MNAIQREMHSARSTVKPRVLFPQTEKQPSQIQQVGLTLKPRGFFQKKSNKNKTQTKKPEEKRPVIVRSGNQTTGPQYQTAVPQPNAKPGQSEIQRQLEALYRRDGRQMPPMQLDALPKTANSGSAAGRRSTTSNATPQNAAAPQKFAGPPQQKLLPQLEEKKKWYEKFLPAKTKQTPKRLPQSHQVVKKAPVEAPVATKTTTAPPQLPAAPAPAPAQPSIVAGPPIPAEQTESIAKTPMRTTEELELDEEAREELEEEATERLEEQRIAAAKQAKEAVVKTPLIEEETAEIAQKKIVISPEDDFNNLFPEMSEEEADSFKKPKVAQEAPPKESPQTPFSGLVLEEDGLKKSDEKPAEPSVPAKEGTPQVAQETPKKEMNPFEPQPAAPTAPEKEGNPFEVPAPKVAEKAMEKPEDNPFKPQPEQKLDTPPAQPEKRIATSEPDSSIEKKLALIASRGNIKGLKGFCPVALRDNRLLVDARPEFSSSYKSMNYQFASLENKLKFDREPAKYAPAAGGSDLVLLVDHQDDKEGTLDFASWYKGRLYLFSNQSNMNVFMKTPALYVGVE
tara:strand:+ start:245604 stop:247304 length:1701 start_codon:yes stop_codon:yes gene_type:complete